MGSLGCLRCSVVSRSVVAVLVGIALPTLWGCSGWVSYEGVQLGSSKPVNLSRSIRQCSELVEREIGTYGLVVLYYPPSLDRASVQRITEDYARCFELLPEVLVSCRWAEVHAYVVPVDSIPESFRYKFMRRGKEWHQRYLTLVLLSRQRPFESREYWS